MNSGTSGMAARLIQFFITLVAAAVAPGAEGLFFLPYLQGERTPHADPYARGCFVGITGKHTRGHLARSRRGNN